MAPTIERTSLVETTGFADSLKVARAFGLVEQGGRVSEGFRVDLHALEEASKGVSDTVQAAQKDGIADLDAGVEFGHERLAGTVTDFCDRWDVGVAHLAEDGSEVAGRLAHCAQVYRQTDEAARAQLAGLIARSAGDDPAAD